MPTIRVLFVASCLAGCSTSNEDDKSSAPANAPSGTAGQANGATESPKRTGIIGKTTNQVIDLHKGMAENPDLVVVDLRVEGSDPLSMSASAYHNLAPKVGKLGLDQMIQHHKILEERNPTYDEITEWIRKHGIRLPLQSPYRSYAYDDQKGEIVVVEDTAEKRRRYEAAGIDVD